ncbi:MAG TPA: hypothetical protein VFS91_06750 [Nitrobacter sp.]|nr:hypothetical protein [Nitrobacter sp.]
MADEAFALSPISARAAPPSEADFDAIREAFMETSRGRWFLTEYAKRNRNADTAMVLDAVARIEQTVAAQQQAAPDDSLPKALAAIRRSLTEARAAATAAFDEPTRDDALAPIERGVRIIREISWRWREIGGDSRICDLLDSQAGAIETVHALLAARDDTAALQVAFGLIETTLDELSDSPAATASPPSTKTAPSSPATSDEATDSLEETAPPEQAIADAIVAESETAAVTAPEAQVGAADEATATRQERPAPAAAKDEQDMAHDDAVLDMIALEMGAPDFDEPETDHTDIGGSETAEPEPAPEPIADNSNAHSDRETESMPEIAAAPSLGASLLANGIVPRATPRSDPLAPFRRMTQAEKIAFFS